MRGGLPSEVLLPLAVLVVAALGAVRFASPGHSRLSPPPSVALAGAQGTGVWELSWDGWTVRVHRDPNDGSTDYTHVGVPIPRESLIRRIAEEEGIDWKLLAAVALAGRQGDRGPDNPGAAAPRPPVWIPDAAVREVGPGCCRSEAERLQVSARYLRRLLDRFSPASPEDRVPLALAAYRMGLDHLGDAQMLAREFDFDPLRWKGSVEGMIGLLEVPAFAQRVPNGFAHGSETRHYVSLVIAHYRALQERHAP